MTDDERKEEVTYAVDWVVTWGSEGFEVGPETPDVDDFRREWVQDHASEEWLNDFLTLMQDVLPRLAPKQSDKDASRIFRSGDFLGEWLKLHFDTYLPKVLPLVQDPLFRGLALTGLAEVSEPAYADLFVPVLLPLEAATNDFYEDEWSNWIQALGDTNDPKALAALRCLSIPSGMNDAQHYLNMYLDPKKGLLQVMPWSVRRGKVTENTLAFFRKRLNREWLIGIVAFLSDLPETVTYESSDVMDLRTDPALRQSWVAQLTTILVDWLAYDPGLVLGQFGLLLNDPAYRPIILSVLARAKSREAKVWLGRVVKEQNDHWEGELTPQERTDLATALFV